MKDGNKLFITTGGGVGDLIMFTPALRRVKELYPHTEITILTKAQTVGVIDRIPWIDKVVGIKRGTFMSRFRALEDLWNQDYFIVTDWQPHLLPFATVFGIPHRIGYPRSNNPLSHLFTDTLKYSVLQSTDYAGITNAKLFGDAFGINLDGDMTKPDISMPNDEELDVLYTKLKAKGLHLQDPYILLTPYSSCYDRDWPAEYIYEFCRTVEERYHMPVVVAGVTKELHDPLHEVPFNLVNQTTFPELVGLVDRAQYHISVDSGPMHVAAAVGTPVISLFNKDLPSRWAPRHHSYPIYLVDESFSTHYGYTPELVNPNDVRSIYNITPELVCSVVDRVIQ